MGTQWARQELKKNDLALAIERTVLWLRFHQQASIWGGIALIAAVLVAVAFSNRVSGEREESWGRFAVAQSYAYSRQPQAALDAVRALNEEFPSSAASSYGLLLVGDIFFEQNEFPKAREAYQKVVDRPNHKEVLPLAVANLALAQEAGGDCANAMSSARRFLDSHTDHFLAPPVHASLARCLAATGQNEQARATYERMAFLYKSGDSDTYWSKWAKDRLKS